MLVSRLTRTAVPGDLSDLPDGGRQILRAIRGAWINELTDRQRYYLLLYYRDLHTMQDIAEISGVTIGTVSRTLRRARNRLKRVLQYYTL
ncbi:MAG: sigma-70 family RNA polymerase sigma factor [Oscillospiraceae bacterium]|nr:sigma-70 family RNA polymerase sigma factor [Oscillospiraceae bacterium]